MDELYYLNPYLPFVARDSSSWLMLSADTLVPVPDDATECRRALLDGSPVTMGTLVHELGNHTTRLLLEHHAVLDYEPHNDDTLARTRGLLSLSGNESYLERLAQATVLLLGAGAIGTHTAWILAAYGIRHLIILDDDEVEASNLNRQLLYTPADIGQRKVQVITRRLHELRPALTVTALDMRLTSADQLIGLIETYRPQAVVKALDTPEEATGWINTACVRTRVPYTTGGFLQQDAVVGPTYVPGRTPCLDCFENSAPPVHRLAGMGGTCSTVTSFTASLIADEVVRMLTGQQPVESGRMTVRHGTDGTIEHRSLALVSRCSTCRASHRLRPEPAWRYTAMVVWALCLCALPFLVTLPWWSLTKTLSYWGACAVGSLLLPRAHRNSLVAIIAVAYASLAFAMTVRFNPQVLGLQHLPALLAVARTVIGYVLTVSIAAMLMVVLASVVQVLAAALMRAASARGAIRNQEVGA